MSNQSSVLVSLVQAWNASHPASQRIDPQAELAVSGTEGLSGGIGDGGHAFGPNQLNNAGGVITGKFAGETPQQINAWAWSPAGINYALSGIAKVAGGLTGTQAVNAIVKGFERPLDPTAEIQAANGNLGSYGTLAALPATATPTTPFAPKVVGTVPTTAAAATPSTGLDASTQAILEALLASHPANQTPVSAPAITPLATAPATAPSAPAPIPAFSAPAPLTFQSLAAPPVFK